MRRVIFCGALFLMTLTSLVSSQMESKASELNKGEWRIGFTGIQKTESVKVTINADGASYNFKGTPANLGIIFKAQSGKFQPAQRFSGKRVKHFIMMEPVIITVRRSGKQLKQIKADHADIAYEKVN